MLAKLAHIEIPVISSNHGISIGWMLLGLILFVIPVLIATLIEFFGVKNYYPTVFKK